MTFDNGNVTIVGQVANLPNASGKLADLPEKRYYAMLLAEGQDLKRTVNLKPFISKNVYAIWEQGQGSTVIVEVKEVSKCYVLSTKL